MADWAATPDMVRENGKPTWSTREVAETFLGISRWTLVKWLATGRSSFVPGRRANGSYVPWRLCDVQTLAFALADNRTIDTQRLRLCMVMIHTVAEQYGFC